LLPYPGQLALSISELLTGGLKPSLQLCNLSVAGGQVIRCPRQLGLKIILLLGRLVLDFTLLPCQALPLRAEIGKIRLGGCLCLTQLLEALLNLTELCSPRGQFLGGSADRLAGRRRLTASLLHLTVQISELLSADYAGLFAGRKLLPHRSQPLLRLRQLVLEFRQALRQRRGVAVQLGGPLLICLQVLLRSGGLRLNLGSGPGELRQLLLLCLQVLQSGSELRLSLLACLGDLGELLLGCLERLLQGPELSLKLVA
jgi:hypothetical protein